ncbi:MAG: nickel/cobalt transporter [Hyphomicrobiales bacterium]
MMISRILLLIFLMFFFLNIGDGVLEAQQNSPFGVSAPQAPAPVGGDFLRDKLSWIYQQQAVFYKKLTGIVKQAKDDGSAVWGLIGLSFLYGIFHAAGPGHGKVVISSYVLANEQTVRRGMTISFLSAFLQGSVAVALIGSAVFFFNLTSFAVTEATQWFERASYALIAALGLFLLWQKGVRPYLKRAPVLVHEVGCAHEQSHTHSHHHDHSHSHSHKHSHSHEADCGCSGHAPDPSNLTQPLTLRSAWAAILSVGLRPCSGALIVLVFSAAQGLFLVGVVSTFAMALGTAITVSTLATIAIGAKGLATAYLDGTGSARWVFKSIELLGASFVFLLGITLLSASFYG